jgi:hypothetical protein
MLTTQPEPAVSPLPAWVADAQSWLRPKLERVVRSTMLVVRVAGRPGAAG